VTAVTNDDFGASARRDVLMLAALGVLLWMAPMGGWVLQGRDEVRYSQIARELLEGGNPLRLTLDGEAYDEKPPLAFWMMAGAMWLYGDVDASWPARLPGCLAAIVTVLLTYDLGRRRWNRHAGLAAGLILMASPMFAKDAVVARLDMVYTLWVTIALYLWLRASGRDDTAAPAADGALRDTHDRRRPIAVFGCVGFWVSLVAAAWTRNVLFAVLLVVLMGIESFRRRSWHPWRIMWPSIGVPLMILGVGGWWYAQHVIQGGVMENQLGEQLFDRLSLTAQHAKPPWYYLLSLAGEGFGPWGVLLGISLVDRWWCREGDTRLNGALSTLTAWFVLVLVVMSVVPTKRPEYLIPLYPAMAILVGTWLEARVGGVALTINWRRFLSNAAYVASVALGVAAVAMLAHPSLAGRYEPDLASWRVLLVFPPACSLGVLAWWFRKARTVREAIWTGVGCALVGQAVYFYSVRPTTHAHNHHRKNKVTQVAYGGDGWRVHRNSRTLGRARAAATLEESGSFSEGTGFDPKIQEIQGVLIECQAGCEGWASHVGQG